MCFNYQALLLIVALVKVFCDAGGQVWDEAQPWSRRCAFVWSCVYPGFRGIASEAEQIPQILYYASSMGTSHQPGDSVIISRDIEKGAPDRSLAIW